MLSLTNILELVMITVTEVEEHLKVVGALEACIARSLCLLVNKISYQNQSYLKRPKHQNPNQLTEFFPFAAGSTAIFASFLFLFLLLPTYHLRLY